MDNERVSRHSTKIYTQCPLVWNMDFPDTVTSFIRGSRGPIRPRRAHWLPCKPINFQPSSASCLPLASRSSRGSVSLFLSPHSLVPLSLSLYRLNKMMDTSQFSLSHFYYTDPSERKHNHLLVNTGVAFWNHFRIFSSLSPTWCVFNLMWV